MAGHSSLFGAPALVLVLAVSLAAFLGPAVQRSFTILGVFRKPQQTVLASVDHLKTLDGTAYCEDLHYHKPSNLLFTACDDVRLSWFPPIANFDDSTAGNNAKGELKTIDPVVGSLSNKGQLKAYLTQILPPLTLCRHSRFGL